MSVLAEVLFIDGRRPVRALDVALAEDGGERRLAVRRSRRPASELRVTFRPRVEAARRSFLVHEVGVSEQGRARLFVVHSEAWLARDRTARERAMTACGIALRGLADRVARGDLRSPLRIARSAARILELHEAARYYDWQLTGGAFRFFERPDLGRELALEGKLVIEVERSAPGPAGQPGGRVWAQAMTAALALLLERAVERGSTAALPSLAREALRDLGAARVVYGPMSTTGAEAKARARPRSASGGAPLRPRCRLP
jgi:hypothetical protein